MKIRRGTATAEIGVGSPWIFMESAGAIPSAIWSDTTYGGPRAATQMQRK